MPNTSVKDVILAVAPLLLAGCSIHERPDTGSFFDHYEEVLDRVLPFPLDPNAQISFRRFDTYSRSNNKPELTGYFRYSYEGGALKLESKFRQMTEGNLYMQLLAMEPEDGRRISTESAAKAARWYETTSSSTDCPGLHQVLEDIRRVEVNVSPPPGQQPHEASVRLHPTAYELYYENGQRHLFLTSYADDHVGRWIDEAVRVLAACGKVDVHQ